MRKFKLIKEPGRSLKFGSGSNMMEENFRKLAHIELIESLSPIEGADKIEVAQVLGWQCVVKKGEFNINDKCIYIEIDSVVKECQEFEFLRKYKFRVKTQKIRGVISQGLAIPLQTFNISEKLEVGTDVTELLGITKYLTPSEREEIKKVEIAQKRLTKFMKRYSWFRKLFLSRTQKQSFPYWVVKTDEPRCISGSSILNTDKGDFTIKEICESKENFKVKSFNIETNEIEYKDIIGTGIMSNNNDWYEIELEDSTKLILTSEHPVYLPELNCYRQVKDLKSNDLVLLDK